jgi:hypothetical protein
MWMPIQCAFLLWLHMPMTLGAQLLYIHFIRPFHIKHHGKIDGEYPLFNNSTLIAKFYSKSLILGALSGAQDRKLDTLVEREAMLGK